MNKKQKQKDIKKIIWLLLLIALLGIYNKHALIKPIVAYAPYDRHTYLPKNPDKKKLTIPEQIEIIANKECSKRNLGRYCIADLEAMAWVETKFNCKKIGDFGASKGCYQIHQGYHPEIKQQWAEDLEFAIPWVLNRLQHYGYPKYRSYAIMKHNGTPYTEKTLDYLKKVNSFIQIN